MTSTSPAADNPAAARVEIFRAGEHTAMNGQRLAFSQADLQAIAAAYDPAVHEAPVTVGHPTGAAPAYGWVTGLHAEGDALYADLAQLDPAFVDMVRAGRFKKRSAALYTPGSPNNPRPGGYYVQHVAFLGAQAPAVKGLRDVPFADGDDQVVVFGDWTTSTLARMTRSLRDWLIAKFGQEEAERALPAWDVQSLADEAVREAMPAASTQAAGLSYAEGDPMSGSTDLAAREAALAQGQAALAEREAALAQREASAAHAARTAEFSEFVDGLVREGRLLPKDRAAVVGVMAALPQAQVLQFGEGDQLVSKPAVEVMQDFLRALPKAVHFGEHAGAGKTATTDVDTTDGTAIAEAALLYQENERQAGRAVSLEQAVQHIVTQHKES